MKSDTQNKGHSLFFRLLIVIILSATLLSFTVSALLLYKHIDYRQNLQKNNKAEVQSLTRHAKNKIETILKQTQIQADALADSLSYKKLTESALLNSIKNLVKNNPEFYGATVGFCPFGYDTKRRLYAPFFYRSNESTAKIEFTQVENVYDYTTEAPEHNWYLGPLKMQKCWSEPYWGSAGKAYMVTYSSVFYRYDSIIGQKVPLGVVAIALSLDSIKAIIEKTDLGPGGFGALVSKNGTYLYHPDKDYVVSRKTLLQVAVEKYDRNRIIAAKMAKNGKDGILDHKSITTREAAWLVITSIPSTGWSLQNTFIKKDLEIDVDLFRHQRMNIVTVLVVSFIFLLTFLYLITPPIKHKAWFSVIFIAGIMISGICAVWDISLNYNSAGNKRAAVLLNKETIHKEMDYYLKRSDSLHLEKPIYVKTGIFIDAIKFLSSSDMLMSGLIWQKYDSTFPKNVSKEVTLLKASKMSIKEVTKSFEHSTEVICFRFEAEIRERLAYKTYPLDQELIKLILIHKELNHNIVLIPDLDAYQVLSPSQKPGLDTTAFIPGWKIKKSYYDLKKRSFTADFGMRQTVKKDNFPVLCFNIGIQRMFINAFISNLTPLIIVSIMLFFILLLGLTTDKVLSICVGMFFVIVFSHINIRSTIAAQEIFYLEYFFFLIYGSILYVVITSLGAQLKADHWKKYHLDRFAPLIYWPTLLSLVFIATVKTFY